MLTAPSRVLSDVPGESPGSVHCWPMQSCLFLLKPPSCILGSTESSATSLLCSLRLWNSRATSLCWGLHSGPGYPCAVSPCVLHTLQPLAARLCLSWCTANLDMCTENTRDTGAAPSQKWAIHSISSLPVSTSVTSDTSSVLKAAAVWRWLFLDSFSICTANFCLL